MSHKWRSLFMFIVLLVAVSGTATAQDDLDGVDPTGATVVWWHSYSGPHEAWMLEQVAQFNQENQWGITVEPMSYSDSDTLREAMEAAFESGGTLPNLVVGDQNDQSLYQQTGALVDIRPYTDSAQWGVAVQEIPDFYPVFWEQDTHPVYDNQQLGFPLSRSVIVMYYNRDWLTQLGYTDPPKTWGEFNAVACDASNIGAGTVGYTFYEDIESASVLAAQVFSRGGDIKSRDGLSYNFNTAEMTLVLQRLQDLINDGCASAAVERHGDLTNFANQKTLFTMASSADLPDYQAALAGSSFEWGIAPIPSAEDIDPVSNIHGESFIIPATTPAQQLAAWLFIKWFTNPEVQAGGVETGGYFPIRASTVDQKPFQEYLEAHPHYAEAYQVLHAVRHMYEPQFANYDAVRELMAQASIRVAQGENVGEVVEWLQEAAISL